jgi:Patatin-like phospholipase
MTPADDVVDGAVPEAARETGDEPLYLYEVLVEEYQSQQREPAMPPELLAGLASRRAELERQLANGSNGSERAADPDACRQQIDSELTAAVYAWLHRHGARRSALCFSGGGIRSATFGLGVLQGLARRGLVHQLDYLSTVSGGGYLGGWLTAWIHRETASRQRRGEAGSGLEAVEAELSRAATSPLAPEPEPVRHLRSYSRYMSPKTGFLSADTWTLIGIYLRNIILNWTVLLPLMAAALMFPRVSSALLRLPETQSWPPPVRDQAQQVLLWISIGFGLIAFAYLMINRPSVVARARWPWTPAVARRGPDLRNQGWFLALCLLPLWLMALGITTYWAWIGDELRGEDVILRFDVAGWLVSPRLAFVLFGAGLAAGGFLLSRLWVRIAGLGDLAELVVVSLCGALGGLLLFAVALHVFPDLSDMIDVESYICTAGPLVLLVFLVAAILFVGIASRRSSDQDREWLARAGSWALILITMRCLLSAIVVFGPMALVWSRTELSLTSFGGISGLITLLLGRSDKTPGKQKEVPEQASAGGIARRLALALALPVFCVFLLALISLGTSLLMRWLDQDYLPNVGRWEIPTTTALQSGPLGMLNVIYSSPWLLVLVVAAGLTALGSVMGLFVNVNKFSLHAAYRDRLIRAYLGASRRSAERRPNPFTGFDEDDNLQMHELAHPRPLHLLNLALNLVGGKELAWQDRKAAPLSVSRLHVGSHVVGYRSARRYGYNRAGDEAITLGTAIAISGAAASPNMGYHSSPLVTFLMTLFNVRLGWWLGNPGRAGRKTFDRPGPGFAPGPMVAEALGMTNRQNPWVYLSDGGHFENLGLYEMVLRRCHFIIVSDGGQDAGLTFEDLGNAASKIRIDLGVPILFEKLMMKPRDSRDEASYNLTRGDGVPYCAVGRICYSCVDRPAGGGPVEDGLLLFIKASLNGTEPVDVYHYAKAHPAFPHEPTENQLYTEPQFESYRALGSHIVDWLVGKLGAELPAAPRIEDLAAALDKGEAAEKSQFGRPGRCE